MLRGVGGSHVFVGGAGDEGSYDGSIASDGERSGKVERDDILMFMCMVEIKHDVRVQSGSVRILCHSVEVFICGGEGPAPARWGEVLKGTQDALIHGVACCACCGIVGGGKSWMFWVARTCVSVGLHPWRWCWVAMCEGNIMFCNFICVC